MKVAVTYDRGQVGQHFGHTEQFKVYEVEDNRIVSSSLIGTGDAGHCALGGFLGQQGVEVLICGGIGQGAVHALEAAGIALYGGTRGDVDEVVSAYLQGMIEQQAGANCDHAHGQSSDCHGHASLR